VSIVADRDQLWRKFLYALYDATAESPSTSMLDFRVVAESVGIESVSEQANVAQWLVAHHLAEWRAVGGQIGISSAGVDALDDEGREIAFLSVVEIRQVEALLTEIRRACELNEVTVHDEDRTVFTAELATIEAQIKSPSPKRKVVGGALRSLGGPLLHADAGALGGSVLQLAQHLMR
jgi:hypothetical protein